MGLFSLSYQSVWIFLIFTQQAAGSSEKLLGLATCDWKEKSSCYFEIVLLSKFFLFLFSFAGASGQPELRSCRDSLRDSLDVHAGKDDQLFIFFPPSVGRIHPHLGLPAKEPTDSPQEETPCFLLQKDRTQRR